MKSYSIIRQVLGRPPYFRYFLLLWLLSVSVFLWLVNINLLIFIWSSPALTFIDKVDFMLDAYVNFFRVDSPVSLSRMVFSLLLAISLTLMVFLWRATKQRQGAVKNSGGAIAAMVGSHCIACGASLTAPLLTALAGGSSAYLSAERFAAAQLLATSANLLGIVIVVLSIRSMTRRIIAGRLLS